MFCFPFQLLPGEKVIEILVSTYDPGQAERCHGSFDVANQSLGGTTLEVSMNQVEDRTEMLADHAVGTRHFKAGNIKQSQ